MNNTAVKSMLRYTPLFFLLLGAIYISGCWDWHEMNQLAIVAGTAVDRADSPGKITVTVQIVKTGEAKGPSGGGDSGGSGGRGRGKPVWVTKSSGNTVSEAVRNFTFQSERKLYWPHNMVIIISKDIARQGVRPILDFFLRDLETRETNWILIADGNAGDVLQVPGQLEKISAIEINRMVETQSELSETADANLEEFAAHLTSKTTAPIASRIQVIDNGGDLKIRLIGTAVFRQDKLVGELDKKETRGFLWVLGKVKHGTVVINAPQKNGKVSIQILQSASKVKAGLKNGKPHLKVEIRSVGNLSNQTGTLDLSKPELLRSLQIREANAIKNEIGAAFGKAKQFKADIFGFGEAIHRKYPKEWKQLEPQWDLLFPQLEIEIAVKTRIYNLGLTNKPIIPEKAH